MCEGGWSELELPKRRLLALLWDELLETGDPLSLSGVQFPLSILR